MHTLKYTILGSVDTVRAGLKTFIADTGVNEVMIVCVRTSGTAAITGTHRRGDETLSSFTPRFFYTN